KKTFFFLTFFYFIIILLKYFLPWIISPTTHSIITSTIRSAHHNCNSRYLTITYGINKMYSGFYNTFFFIFLSHHKSCGILKEKEWYIPIKNKFKLLQIKWVLM